MTSGPARAQGDGNVGTGDHRRSLVRAAAWTGCTVRVVTAPPALEEEPGPTCPVGPTGRLTGLNLRRSRGTIHNEHCE